MEKHWAIVLKNIVYGEVIQPEKDEDEKPWKIWVSQNVIRETEMRYKTEGAAQGQLTKRGWEVQNQTTEITPYVQYVERVKANVKITHQRTVWQVVYIK